MTTQASARTLVADIGDIFRPPRRVRVSDAVEKSVMIATPGGYAGKWSGSQTPYMVEPMDMIASRDHSSVIFAGPARTGKSLDVLTPIATPDGWTTMGELKIGDYVFGDDGEPVEVDLATDFMHDHTCYRVDFAYGESIVADADHLWQVVHNDHETKILTTQEMVDGSGCYEIPVAKPLRLVDVELPADLHDLGSNNGSDRWRITNIVEVESRPVRCIRVKNESHLFLAGRSMIPTHNTQGLIDGGVGYIITCDPSDILVIHMTEEAARRYSRLRVKRMLNNSPDLKAKMSTITHDDNVLGKYFRNGTALILAWPSPTQLSAQDYKYVFMSDYDRMPDDCGEGDVFSLGMKRTQTFMSGGKAVAESSPGRDFTDASWKPKTIHEAPPVGGILGLYNNGDRRIWHWSCPECTGEIPVIPGLELFNLPEQAELIHQIKKEGAKAVSERLNRIVCPNCGSEIPHDKKNEMNLSGYWKAESDRPNSSASYWLGGAAAKFQTWQSLLEKEFLALMHFAATGEEEKLKATRNTDQGIPYIPVGAAEKMSAEELEARAEDLPKRLVPAGVRFLLASVDVQANRFVCQVQGVGVDMETWIIDRFDIAISARESHGEMATLDPAGHKEDWDMLIERVIEQRYALEDASGRDMGIIMTTCDSGGKEGVTENAYHFWKRIKGLGLADRFNLIKGERPRPTVNKPMVSKSAPDKSSTSGA